MATDRTATAPGSTPDGTRRSWGGRELALLLLGAEVCRHLDAPVRAAGVLFAAVAVWLGISLLVRRRAAPSGPARTLWVSFGLVLAGTLLVVHVVLLVISPLYTGYERCLDGAQTREASRTCQVQFMERLQGLR